MVSNNSFKNRLFYIDVLLYIVSHENETLAQNPSCNVGFGREWKTPLPSPIEL